MREQVYVNYHKTIKYYYKSYEEIGIHDELSLKVNNSKLKNLYKLIENIRSHFNKENKRYKNFSTYSEWKDFVIQDINSKNYGKSNILHFIKVKKNERLIWIEAFGGIVIPFYSILLSLSITFVMNTDAIANKYVTQYLKGAYIYLGMIIVGLIGILSFIHWTKKRYLYFYDEMIEIVQKYIKSTINK